MKVKDLIRLLQQVNQELTVFTTYDTYCCTDELEAIIVLGENNPTHYGEGVFLTGTDVDFILNDAMNQLNYSANILKARNE